jgi:hypothetical protein
MMGKWSGVDLKIRGRRAGKKQHCAFQRGVHGGCILIDGHRPKCLARCRIQVEMDLG